MIVGCVKPLHSSRCHRRLVGLTSRYQRRQRSTKSTRWDPINEHGDIRGYEGSTETSLWKFKPDNHGTGLSPDLGNQLRASPDIVNSSTLYKKMHEKTPRVTPMAYMADI
jgi:hypothetical protein